ncbi:hypothetical protein GCM10008967_38730 [Bacillus carboniphilus]|uniref:EthD domain-containing protein n=1 Tax=Bacillus carboniphilus TaxID=86663 RepID=A0ABP3GFX1_9BACI
MYKVIVLYKKPENPQEFDEYYFNTHMPITKKIPGLQEVKVTKLKGETEYYMMCEMYYESKDAFKAASQTEEAKVSMKDAMKFAGHLATFMFGDEENV